MGKNRKRLLAGAAVVTLAAGLAACGGGSDDNEGSNNNAEATKGGTLNVLVDKPYEHMDPQRTYLGVQLSNFSRTVYRSLVAYPITDDPEKNNQTPVPDIATDTGTSSNEAKTWKFTLRDGVKWEDGKPVTCDDFKYGASRVFATDVITGGPNYILGYLDVPTDPKTGLPVYDGPYKGDGQAAFDKAITCDGNTITYNFKKPWPDFPNAIASLHMMDPYRKDKDQGAKNNYFVFSNGPYKIEGNMWDKNKGSALVRNDQYDKSTDPEDIRRALPNEIDFEVGVTPETTMDRILADTGDDQTAITSSRVPPTYFPQLSDVQDRHLEIQSPYVDYLQVNFKNVTDPKVREAIKVATNTKGWIDAGGGETSYTEAKSIVSTAVNGYKDNPAFDGITEGDPAAAKKLLEEAGVKTPYPLTFTYPKTDTADKQARALKETWDEAGFNTTLDGLGDTYYDVVQQPEKESDLIWAGWGADWPSAITVTPPLFDSRINLTSASTGQDYGSYASDKVNKLFDEAADAASIPDQTKALQAADEQLGKDVAYIPLESQVFQWIYGSKVVGFNTSASSSSYPDLGPIGVEN